MKAQCKEAVENAIGRKINAAESRNLEQRVRDGMLQLARQDPQRWATLSASDRLFEGAKIAAEELVAEANKRKQRAAQMIVAHDRIKNYLEAQVAAGHDKDKLSALRRLVAGAHDGKNNSTSAESAAKGILAQSMGRLAGAFESIKPGLFGLLANKEAESQMVRALHGVRKGIRPEIIRAAEEWGKLAEALRMRFNAAGGTVGKLDNWGMPHSWSQDLAAKMGKEKFVDDFMQWIDRSKYMHEDGRAFTEAELREFLGQAWITIVSEGANKRISAEGMPPGGRSVKANRNSEARQIHLRDGDASLAALRAYSGRNVIEAMVGHISRMSRDIALIETFGPNADYTVQHFIDTLRAEMADADPTRAGEIKKQIDTLINNYDFVAGNSPPPPNRRLANAFAALRAWMTMSKLGSAAITSVSDEGTLYLTARVNNLPALQVFMNEMRALNPANQMEKRLAQRAGLMMHSMADSMDRWGTDTLGSQVPTMMASAILRASGLSAITEARRRAFSITMMDAIGALTRQFKKVSDLDADDYAILRGKGITDEEWAIWRAAEPDSWRGNDTVLTPDAIYALSDDQVRSAIAPIIADLQAKTATQLTKLADRIINELGWQGKRAQKVADYQQSKLDELDQYRARREQWTAEDETAAKEIRDAAEAMQEQAAAEAAISRAFREAESQQVMREILFAIEDGLDPNKAMGKVSTATARGALSATEIGFKLGRDLAAARRKAADAAAAARRRASKYEAQTGAKAEAIGRLIGKRIQQYNDFVASSNARIQKMNDIADAIRARAPDTEAQAIAVARERAASKLLAVVLEEQDMAIIEPGARERSLIQGGTARGTWGGELRRSFFQFKTFPIAMMMRHWGRAMGLYSTTRGKAGYMATLIAAQTLLGAVAMELNDIASGKDPRNLDPRDEFGARNWISALLKGGSLGLYGDFLFAETTNYGQSLLGTFVGPIAGLVEDVDGLTRENVMQYMRDEDTNVGAETVKFVKAYTPGSSLWYTKAATDRLIFFQLQEYFSPGYVDRMKDRARERNGTTYWWDPNDQAPERAPDLEAAGGE